MKVAARARASRDAVTALWKDADPDVPFVRDALRREQSKQAPR
jgi:hypothetical protein